ncbi:hypothetical protein EB796_014867 [Bugula neritina]|uniref:Uncharacterized protein n=1 Tax=Bugula neritina TaxID=10212 RepID=A0A7J7JN22_BUGNE|nr:hypothetical protein EB796_014867 [Bugula neritina]
MQTDLFTFEYFVGIENQQTVTIQPAGEGDEIYGEMKDSSASAATADIARIGWKKKHLVNMLHTCPSIYQRDEEIKYGK